MAIRVLGAHNLETRHTRHTCLLIDGVLAIDAGSLASALSLTEHNAIRALLLTHGHFDHFRDLPTLGLATLDNPHHIDVYALAETLASVQDHLMDGTVYPDLTRDLRDAPAKYRLHPVKPLESFQVLRYHVKAVPAHHPVPALGYIVRPEGRTSFAYTGDSGGSLLPLLQDPNPADVLFVDVTFPNRLEQRANTTGHLTPALLAEQLRQALKLGLRIPRIVPVHLGVQYQAELANELSAEAERLGIDLKPGHEDMIIE